MCMARCGGWLIIFQNVRKVCAHHFSHLDMIWKKNSATAFYPCTVIDVHLYKIFRYLVTGCHKKLSSSYRLCQKRWTVPPKCCYAVQLFKMFWSRFIRDDLLLCTPVHSNFTLRRQVAPLQSIKFQTADLQIFCAPIIVIFRTTCIDIEVVLSW